MIPGLGRCPGGGHGNPLQCSCWRIPLLRLAWALQSRGEGLSAAASCFPPALGHLGLCRLGRSAPCSPSGEPPPRLRPPASSGVWAVVAAEACRRRRLVPGTLEPVVGRPWRPLSERSFLRRPSQGLRFSRQTRRRAPEAGITGGDNPGASEIWASLLLLKIGRAGFQGVGWRCEWGGLWLLARVDQHLPAPIHPWGFGAGRERVFLAKAP